MKKVVYLVIGIFMSSTALAVDLAGTDSYYGKIDSVAVGFFSSVGVAL